MKRQDKFISRLVDKVLKETIEGKAEKIESQLKHKEMKETHTGSKIKSIINTMKGEVKERHGMDDAHPKLGPKKLKPKMTKTEIDDILNQLRAGDYGDADHEDYIDEIPSRKKGNWVHPHDEELDELHDSGESRDHFGDMEYDEFNFEPMKNVRPNMDDLEGGTTHGREFMKDFKKKSDFINKLKRGFRGEENEETLYEIEMEKQLCECGSGLYENECNECGNSYGMMDESDEIETNEGGCNAIKEVVKSQGHVSDLDKELMERYGCSSLKESFVRRGLISESLKGNQKKIDKNKNNKIDSEDFEILRRGKKSETKESLKGGQKNLDKNKNNKIDAEDFKLLRKGKKTETKETIRVTETELISLIEKMINEDLKTVGNKPRGLGAYEKAHKESGNENKKYFSSLKKKMDDYLKDGSKGDYDMNPSRFPKGNGELEKMKTKKYTVSNEGQEFIEDYTQPGMENLDYDEVHPNEEWVTNNIEGSSETGNNPKWANAEETELGEKINKKRKQNKFAKAKRQAYHKSPQPVISDKTGDERGTGLHLKTESTDKQTKVLNEEFNKIKNLMNYDRKTQ
jgi:competence protein ComGC